MRSHSVPELQSLLSGFKDHQQIAGIAVYDAGQQPLAVTAGFSALLNPLPQPVLQAMKDGLAHAGFLTLGGDPMHVVVLPLHDDPSPIGVLAMFNDTAYISARIGGLWRRALIGVAVQTLLIGCITLLTIRFGYGRPLARMAEWMKEMRTGAATGAPAISERGEFAPLSREVNRLAHSLVEARAAAEEEARLRDSAESNWTAERLRVFVRSRLGDDRLFVVSNREPYEHVRRQDRIECVVPASGLVTALEPVLRACDGTWIAQATGDADHEAVDEAGRVRVPPGPSPVHARAASGSPKRKSTVFTSASPTKACGRSATSPTPGPTFRADDWEAYREVNEKFAAAVLEEIADEENPVVLVQDYHFALLPRMVKQRRPDARVAIFWHIPWPNSEAFGICPWQRELLDGLLGADLIGFHIQAPLQQLPGHRGSRPGIACGLGAFLRHARRTSTLVRPFPDQRRASDRAETPGRTCLIWSAPRCSKTWRSRHLHGHRRRSHRLHQRDSGALPRHRALSRKLPCVSERIHVRADRFAQPHVHPALRGLDERGGG